jgi:DNA-binding beta-propeller fold protein YncE
MAADASLETLYISDADYSCVLVYSDKGASLGRRALKGVRGLKSPVGVAFSSKREIFVSEECFARLFNLDALGRLLHSWGSPGIGAGQFYRPRGIMVDERGRVYVIDHGNHRCQVFSADGKYQGVFGATYFIKPAQRGEGDANDDQ